MQPRPKPVWRRVLTVLRFVVSGGLLAYLLLQANPEHIWDVWRTVDLRLLALAVVIQFLGVAVSAYKWGVLLRSRDQQQPYPWLLGIYLAGQFANNFLPTAVGGDAVRVIQLGRKINSFTQASASVFLERLTGFLALSLVACGALVITSTNLFGTRLVTAPSLVLVTAGFTVLAVAIVLASFSAPRLLRIFGRWLPLVARKPLQTIADALASYASRGTVFLHVLLLSFVFHGCWIASHLICGLALNIDAPPLIYALMIPMTDIVGLAPIFVNNVGARELIFSLYLSQVGVASATAIALAFLAFTVRLVVSSLGGLVMLLGGADMRAGRVQQPVRQPETAER